MTVKTQNRFNSKQYDRYSINGGTDFTEWTSLFNYGTPPVQVAHRQEGDFIFDSYTGTQAQLYKDDATQHSVWTGTGGTIIRLYNVGSGSVEPGNLVKLTGISLSGIPQVTVADLGDVYHGVTINGAVAGENVYVITDGTYLVQPANTEAPVVPGDFVEAAANGKYQVLVPGNFYSGWIEIPDVVINAVHYSVMQFRIPVQSFAP